MAHLLRHCRYLIDDGGVRTSLKVLLQLLASFLTLAVMISWIGLFLLGVLGSLGRAYWQSEFVSEFLPPPTLRPPMQWAVGLGVPVVCLIASHVIGTRVVGKVRGTLLRIALFPLLGALFLLLLFVYCYFVPYLLIRLQDTPALSSPAWVGQHLWAIVAVVAGVPVVALTSARRCATIARIAARGRCNMGQRDSGAPWVIFVLLVSWAGTFFYGPSEAALLLREDAPWISPIVLEHPRRRTRGNSVTGDDFPTPTVHDDVEPLLRHRATLEQLGGGGLSARRSCAEFAEATHGQ